MKNAGERIKMHEIYYSFLETLIRLISLFRYDGTQFAENLAECVEYRRKRNIGDKAIQWRIYCGWAHELRRKEVGPEGARYRYPDSVLNFLRSLAKRNVKGEIRKDAYSVDIETFCKYIIGK